MVLSKRKMAGCLIGLVGLLCGCATGGGARPVVVTTDESVVAGQVSAARIEAINGRLGEILQLHDLLIEERIGRAIGGIDDALDALDRYDAFVQEIIRRIRELELATRTGERESTGQE